MQLPTRKLKLSQIDCSNHYISPSKSTTRCGPASLPYTASISTTTAAVCHVACHQQWRHGRYWSKGESSSGWRGKAWRKWKWDWEHEMAWLSILDSTIVPSSATSVIHNLTHFTSAWVPGNSTIPLKGDKEVLDEKSAANYGWGDCHCFWLPLPPLLPPLQLLLPLHLLQCQNHDNRNNNHSTLPCSPPLNHPESGRNASQHNVIGISIPAPIPRHESMFGEPSSLGTRKQGQFDCSFEHDGNLATVATMTTTATTSEWIWVG